MKKSSHSKFLRKVQEHTAEAAIGASALRKQGSPGVVIAARNYLATVQLRKFGSASNEKNFQKLLEARTNTLRNRFPQGVKKNWGAARKALNLFLRDCLYNQYLASEYKLDEIGEWLEVPLDESVTSGLRSKSTMELPKWRGIKNLSRSDSRQYQIAASLYAKQIGWRRVDIDLEFWRP